MADDDEKFFDQNGYEYVPGAGFDVTDENGHWQFLAYGTGLHQASSDSAAFKVLFSYRAEIVSYPDEDVWAPTLQHIGTEDNDWVNSDFDDETQALAPNVEDAAGHDGDYTLPATDNLNDGSWRKAGDLIVLTRLADGSESSTTSGAYATYASQPGGDEDVELRPRGRGYRRRRRQTACAISAVCACTRRTRTACARWRDCQPCRHGVLRHRHRPGPTSDEGDKPVIDVTKPEGGDTTQPGEGDGGESETFTTRVMAASAARTLGPTPVPTTGTAATASTATTT